VRNRSYRAAAVVLCVSAVAAAALTSTATARPASGEPIKLATVNVVPGGAIGNNTGAEALQVYVDDWNRRGGHNGQPIDLVDKDAGFNPGANIAAVQELANVDKVDMFLFIGICKSTLPIVTALKVPALNTYNKDCIGTAPTPAVGKFALDQGAKKVAFVGADFAEAEQLSEPLKIYLERKGLEYVRGTVPLVATAADYDGVVADLKAQNVDTVYALVVGDTAPLLLESANTQGFGPHNGIRWVLYGYDPDSANVPALDGTYAQLATDPWESNTKEIKKARKLLKGKVSALDGGALSGYAEGAQLEAIFNRIKGRATRESITAALKKKGKEDIPLTPLPLDTATDAAKLPSSGQFMQIKDGKWVTVGKFVVVPAKDYS
jgi:ABC-type branched-subunit amino acid transport system substrate-binding protein